MAPLIKVYRLFRYPSTKSKHITSYNKLCRCFLLYYGIYYIFFSVHCQSLAGSFVYRHKMMRFFGNAMHISTHGPKFSLLRQGFFDISAHKKAGCSDHPNSPPRPGINDLIPPRREWRRVRIFPGQRQGYTGLLPTAQQSGAVPEWTRQSPSRLRQGQ